MMGLLKRVIPAVVGRVERLGAGECMWFYPRVLVSAITLGRVIVEEELHLALLTFCDQKGTMKPFTTALTIAKSVAVLVLLLGVIPGAAIGRYAWRTYEAQR